MEDSYVESKEILAAREEHNKAFMRTSGDKLPRGPQGRLAFLIREMRVSLATIEGKIASGSIRPWVDPAETCAALRRALRTLENLRVLWYPEKKVEKKAESAEPAGMVEENDNG